MCATIALILCIIGATSAESLDTLHSQITVKTAAILYVLVYAGLVLLTLEAVLRRGISEKEDEGLV